MLFTKESERCRWRWRCCCTVSAALSLPAVRCLCSRLREARTFNTPSQPSPAQTSPAVVVCREPLLSPPQHHYLLPQLPPTLPPTQGTYCTDSLPSSVSVDSLLSALITLSYHDLPLPTTSYEVPPKPLLLNSLTTSTSTSTSTPTSTSTTCTCLSVTPALRVTHARPQQQQPQQQRQRVSPLFTLGHS